MLRAPPPATTLPHTDTRGLTHASIQSPTEAVPHLHGVPWGTDPQLCMRTRRQAPIQTLRCANTLLSTIPLFKQGLDPALRISRPSLSPAPAPQKSPSHSATPAGAWGGGCPHQGWPLRCSRRLRTSRGCGSRCRWRGSNPLFPKGSFMPLTTTRGRAAWQDSEEPVFNRCRAGKEGIRLRPLGAPLWEGQSSGTQRGRGLA